MVLLDSGSHNLDPEPGDRKGFMTRSCKMKREVVNLRIAADELLRKMSMGVSLLSYMKRRAAAILVDGLGRSFQSVKSVFTWMAPRMRMRCPGLILASQFSTEVISAST